MLIRCDSIYFRQKNYLSVCVAVSAIFSQMDNSLDMDMDGSLNRSLTNSQIYDGEFFEIVGSEGEILVVRYERIFSFLLEISG